jgi:hypothetical protein
MSENPTAFPCAPGDVAYWNEGMSLRDYFAGQVIAICWQQANVMSNIGRVDEENVPIVAAGFSYLVADAMLAAREQGK